MGDGGRRWVELGGFVVAESSFPELSIHRPDLRREALVLECATRSRTTFVAADEALVSLHDVHTFAEALC